MSLLREYPEEGGNSFVESSDFSRIAQTLKDAGITFERWTANQALSDNSTQEEILQAYHSPVTSLMQSCGYVTADVISVHPGIPNHTDLRKKFLDEHTHSEDEARFFVDGCGIFYVHIEGKVFVTVCERGDFLKVPAGTRHWFDMGPRPFLKVIRTFTTPEGWVAEFTGSDIASRFPRFEAIVSVPV